MRLIDADALQNNIALYMAENAYLNDSPLDVLKMIGGDWINEAPTVDAEPIKHGRWIDTDPGYYDCYSTNAHVCSKCHDFYTLDWKYMKYCPNCGAKMDEEVQ